MPDIQNTTQYKVKNWRAYNQALRQRGSITFWIDENAINQWWHTEMNGKRGRDNTYSDIAIQTFLMVQAVYGLSLRATQGFLDSVFSLLGVDLISPDYSNVSKRAKQVSIDTLKPNKAITHHVIDSTGLKVFGEGEWKARKHGKEKRRTWRKLHLGVDTSSQQIVCAELTRVSVADCQALPIMLAKTPQAIGKVSADGAYDNRRCYEAAKTKGAIANYPPRKNATYWEDGHERNTAVSALKEGKMSDWKVDTDYHQRSLSETAMWRYKSLTGDKLRLHNYLGQVGEALARVAVLNKMATLTMPDSKMLVQSS